MFALGPKVSSGVVMRRECLRWPGAWAEAHAYRHAVAPRPESGELGINLARSVGVDVKFAHTMSKSGFSLAANGV
jgi:hypothetical protein